MAGRITRGWSLMKQSWSVLRLDKELMLFPVLSSIACLLVLASFFSPLLFVPGLAQQLWQAAHQQGPDQQQAPIWQNPVWYAVLFGYYFVNYLVVVFFNTALVSCAVLRFRGGDPTVGYGLRAAAARLPQIVAWSLVAATVGMILRMIEERVKVLGKFIVGLIGVAWTVVTYLIVPVLAVERLGPFAAVRRSAELLRKTWGEAIVGNLALGALNFLLLLPCFVLVIAAVAVAAQSVVLALVLGGLAIIYAVGLAIVISTMQQILLAGVYLYAAERRVPSGFSEDLIRSAFRVK